VKQYEIYDAVRNDDDMKLLHLIGQNPTTRALNFADSVGMAPLHYACRDGSSYMVELLIHAGADVNQYNAVGTTPLMLAVKRQSIDMIKLLLGAGADIAFRNDKGLSCFCYFKIDAYLFNETAPELQSDTTLQLLYWLTYSLDVDFIKVLIAGATNQDEKNLLLYVFKSKLQAAA